MKEEKNKLSNIDVPKVGDIKNYKMRLRTALLLEHQNRNSFYMLGSIMKSMSKIQKGVMVGVLAVAIVVVSAGIFGPSAYSVANAQAQDTINRAFQHIANLSDEDRAELEQKFQERMQFKTEANEGFMGFQDLSPEEIEARHQEMKASLTDALAEAQASSDLQIISADELPVPGFFGRAGRAFGMKMMNTPEDVEGRLANLPEDVRQNVEEHMALSEDMRPVSFMVYTNEDGQTVYLGINADDEPVVKIIKPGEGELPFPPGREMKDGDNGNSGNRGKGMQGNGIHRNADDSE